MRARWVLLAALAAGCGGGQSASYPAADGVKQLIAALSNDDPRAAYDLLAKETRRGISYQAFERQWRAHPKERAAHAAALRAALAGHPDVGEVAHVVYSDGRGVVMHRDRGQWRLERSLVGRVRAKRPEEAFRQFASAFQNRDLDAVLRTLTRERRDGIGRQVLGFLDGIATGAPVAVELVSENRAEVRWDSRDVRFRIVIVRQDDEWRIDDIHIRVLPADQEGAEDDANTDAEPKR